MHHGLTIHGMPPKNSPWSYLSKKPKDLFYDI